MKKETPHKSKFKRLKMALGLRHWEVVGILESLWLVTSLNAPAGDIGRLGDEDIAAEIEWDRDPRELIEALVATQWLDRDPDFRLVVHDWSDHVATWLKGSFAKHDKLFADQIAKQRVKQTFNGTSNDSAKQGAKQPETIKFEGAKHGAGDSASRARATEPNLTQPSLAQPQEPSSANADGERGEPSRRSNSAYTAAFERWYATYPRKVGKQEAASAFGRALPKFAASRGLSSAEALDLMCSVTLEFAKSPAGQAGTYTPHPATWLNQGRYDDDQKEWNQDDRRQKARVGAGQRYQGD